MDPSALIPIPDSIPVHWGWFKFLLILTFVLHLLLMNLMLGGGLLALGRRLRGQAPTEEARSLPVLIALTINLGIPPLLFVQVLFGQFLYSSSVLMAVGWILVIPVLIAAYYAAYGFVHGEKGGGTAGTVWLFISTLLMLFIGFMLSNNMTLMLRPERWNVYFAQPGGTYLNLSEPTLIPRYLHFVMASVAVAGLGRAIYYRIRGPRDGEGAGSESQHEKEVRGGLRIFGWSTLVQMAIGLVFWMLLPERINRLFMGTSLVHTFHLWIGVLLAALAVHFAFRGRVWLTTILTLVTIVLMVVVRDMVRTAYLEPVFHLGDLTVVPQANPLVFFMISLVVVTGVLYWMLRQAWKAKA